MGTIRGLQTAICALALSASAGASALLATTPACELLTEKEAGEATGGTMISVGGTVDIAFMSECFWQTAGGGPSLDFMLMEPGMFSPSGQTARDHLDSNVAAMKEAGYPFEMIAGVGEAAMLYEDAGTRFFTLVAGGSYLSIRMRESSREALLTIGRIAATRMAD